MAISLGDGIWNRYVHPGMLQRNAAPIGVYRRLTLTNPDFATAITNRQGATNDAVDHEALPIVPLRPIRDEAAADSPDVMDRVSEIVPSPAIQRATDTTSLPLLPIPIEREGQVVENSPAIEATTILPERPVVRPNAIQRAPDTTFMPALPVEEHDLDSSSATEAATILPERAIVRPNAIQRTPEMTSLVLPSLSSAPTEEGRDLSISPTIHADTILPERPVVHPNAIQRAPDITPLAAENKGQALESKPTIEMDSILPERPVVRPNAIQRASDNMLLTRAGGGENFQRSENIVIPARPANENISGASGSETTGISQTSQSPLVFRSAIYRSPEKNIIVQASPVTATVSSSANGQASPANGAAPSFNGGQIIQRAEPAAPASTSAESPNQGELVDKMLQKFMRRLAVENERRGRW